jgi:hypothetical protein
MQSTGRMRSAYRVLTLEPQVLVQFLSCLVVICNKPYQDFALQLNEGVSETRLEKIAPQCALVG